MRVTNRPIVALLATAVAACSLFADLGGLSGGARDGGGGDAGIDGAGDSAPPDAAVETGPMCPPYVLPASCEAQYLSDDKNCCVAGRDCQGGACVAGQCQPVVLVPDATGDARGIAVSGDLLLWATGCTGVVRKVKKDGTGNVALPKGGNCTPTLAVSGSRVYWIEFDGPFLNGTNIDGASASKVVAEIPIAGARSNFSRLAVDATNAYWANDTPGSVWFAPLNGDRAKPTPLASKDASLTKETAVKPYGVAVDATHVYWSDIGGGIIKRRALANLSADILADVVAADDQPGDLALDNAKLYWVTLGGFVRSRSKDGTGPVTILASNEIGAQTILVDDRYVYWASNVASSSVKRVPKGGGPVEILATKQKAPWELAQDCGTIYWTNHNNFGTGEVVKVTK